MDPRPGRAARAWVLYDVANSAFATTFMAAILPVWFSQVASEGLAPDPQAAREEATRLWGYGNTVAMALGAFTAPMLGALADAGAGRARLLGGFTVAGALLAGLVALGGEGDWAWVLGCYVLARVAFHGAVVFYDGLLPAVAPRDQLDNISTRGFAFGYLGGGLLLALQLAAIQQPGWFGLPDTATATRLSFAVAAAWWLVLGWPLVRRAPRPELESSVPGATEIVRDAFARLRRTFGELRQHREAGRFLLAFWLYNDGIGTIVVMATVFGSELGLSRGHLIGALLLVQLLGFPFSLLFGRLAGKVGVKRAIQLGLVGYLGICLLAWGMHEAWHFWALAAGVSMVQGGCQALSRSLFARLVPERREAEFFGFYDVSNKFSGIAGPSLFALAGTLAGDNRAGVAVLALLFVAGLWILRGVQLPPDGSAAPAQPAAEEGD